MTTVGDPGKKRALGRGLDALLPPAPSAAAAYGDKSVFLCALEKIVPAKGQPRQHFDTQALEELAQSIREHGLIEPIVVRRMQAAPASHLTPEEQSTLRTASENAQMTNPTRT